MCLCAVVHKVHPIPHMLMCMCTQPECCVLLQNEKFYSGVRYAVQKAREMGVEPHVLDIGTGTGLLSLMAAKCGVKNITACEVSPPFPM